jgi:hypothetical protein
MRCATALALAGCGGFDAAGDGDFMDDDLPMGNCSGTGTGAACPQTTSGGVPAGFPCSASGQCEGDLHCVAPFDGEDAGDLFCSAQCIALEDSAWWCLDDDACCDPGAICTPRGLCVMGDALDDTVGDATSSATMITDDGTMTSTADPSSGTADSQTGDSAETGTTGTTGGT